MMLLSDFDYKNFGANEVLRFAKELNDNPDYELVEKTKDLYDKLFCVLPSYDKELDKNLKKIHIPVIVKNLDYTNESEEPITDKEYEAFLLDWFTAGMVCSNYIDYCGQGSTGKTKVEGRISSMKESLKVFIENLSSGGSRNEYGKAV